MSRRPAAGESDFEYGDEESDMATPTSPDGPATVKVQNKPHDEEILLSDDESPTNTISPQTAAAVLNSNPSIQRQSSGKPETARDMRGFGSEEEEPEEDESEDDDEYEHRMMQQQQKMQQRTSYIPKPGDSSQGSLPDGGSLRGGSAGGASQRGAPQQLHSDEESEEDMGPETTANGTGAAGYNAADFAHLQVTDELQELFDYIGRYKPHAIELPTKLKPFIPDYIPAVGDIDEFLKVPRPDGKADYLGLKVLDEPAAHQSDPTVLNLQLRAISKQLNLQPMQVTSIDNADTNPKKITTWINSVHDLHKSKPPPHVSYSKNMPDIDKLMQEWPAEVEELLQNIQLPNADLDVDLRTFIQIICAILDIPVYNNPVESLHVMFTLYLEFKNNPHFAASTQREWESRG